MKLPLKILVILAAVFWIGAVGLFVVGGMRAELSMLRWMAIPDALLAVFFTVLAANKAFK